MTDVPRPVPGSADELINGLFDISGTRTAVPGGTKPRRSVPADSFRAAFRLHPEGVTVVTAVDEFGDQIGMTATAVSSVSLDPPLVLACMANQSRMTSALTGGAGFVVHFLTGEQAGGRGQGPLPDERHGITGVTERPQPADGGPASAAGGGQGEIHRGLFPGRALGWLERLP